MTTHKDFIIVGNGILDVRALLAGERDMKKVLIPHTPRWFSSVMFPYPFDPAAECPTWLDALSFYFEDRAAPSARLLQQFAGYCLLPDTDEQSWLLNLGEGNNGKSAYCAMQTALLGEANVSRVPLELFGDKFRLAGTVGKLANIIGDVGELDRVAEGVIKEFVSGGEMEFEQKFKHPFKERPTARLVINCNSMPRFNDRSEGWWRRILIVPWTKPIPKEKRVKGMDKSDFWHDERPGLLNWALAGLKDLRESGGFVIPEECQKVVEQHRTESNSARLFLKSRYEFVEGHAGSPKEDVYEQYRDWCHANGYHALGNLSFGKEVFRTYPAVKPGKVPRTIKVNGIDAPAERVNGYSGLVPLPPGKVLD